MRLQGEQKKSGVYTVCQHPFLCAKLVSFQLGPVWTAIVGVQSGHTIASLSPGSPPALLSYSVSLYRVARCRLLQWYQDWMCFWVIKYVLIDLGLLGNTKVTQVHRMPVHCPLSSLQIFLPFIMQPWTWFWQIYDQRYALQTLSQQGATFVAPFVCRAWHQMKPTCSTQAASEVTRCGHVDRTFGLHLRPQIVGKWALSS